MTGTGIAIKLATITLPAQRTGVNHGSTTPS